MTQQPERHHPHDADDADGGHEVDTRSELLPEEAAAGSEVPEEQARAILEDSEERTLDPGGTRDDYTQTPDAGGPAAEDPARSQGQ